MTNEMEPHLNCGNKYGMMQITVIWTYDESSPESSGVLVSAAVGGGALGLLRGAGPPAVLGSPQEPTYVDL